MYQKNGENFAFSLVFKKHFKTFSWTPSTSHQLASWNLPTDWQTGGRGRNIFMTRIIFRWLYLFIFYFTSNICLVSILFNVLQCAAVHADSAEQSICRCCSIQWCRLDHLQCEVVHLQWLAAVLCADVCTSAQCTAALSDTTPATTTRTGYKLAKFTTCQHSTAQPVCVGVSRNIGKIMWFLLCEDVNVSVYLSVKTHKSSKSFHHEMSVIKHLFNHWKVEVKLRGTA